MIKKVGEGKIQTEFLEYILFASLFKDGKLEIIDTSNPTGPAGDDTSGL